MFEKCVNTMGYRNALGSYGITIELGKHNHVIAILRYMTILKSEKKASEQVRTYAQESKTQRHCGFKRPMEY
jgi:hypothetical protein